MAEPVTNLVLGNYGPCRIDLVQDGTFESDDNVKEGSNSMIADYMYFGYWLKSPVGNQWYAHGLRNSLLSLAVTR